MWTNSVQRRSRTQEFVPNKRGPQVGPLPIQPAQPPGQSQAACLPASPALSLLHFRVSPPLSYLPQPHYPCRSCWAGLGQERPGASIFFKALSVLKTPMRSSFGSNSRDHFWPPGCHPFPLPLQRVQDRCLLPSLIAHWSKAGGGRSNVLLLLLLSLLGVSGEGEDGNLVPSQRLYHL